MKRRGLRVRRRRTTAWMALALVLGSLAAATASGIDERRGTSMVSSVDLRLSLITLDDQVYRVDERTRIQRFNGVTALLSEIRAPARSSRRLVPADEVDYVRFEASRKGGRWFLSEVTILDGPVDR